MCSEQADELNAGASLTALLRVHLDVSVVCTVEHHFAENG